MTDKELNLAAKPRGHKSPIMLAAFRTGFTAACNGKGRDEHGLGDVPREIKAWQDGWDYLAESQRQVTTADERSIEVDGTTTPVTLHAIAGGGFDVLVPVGGQTVSVYGDTEEIALAAARDRLIAAARDGDDKIAKAYGVDVEVYGTKYAVAVTQFKSGRFEARVDEFPLILPHSGDDEAAVLAFIHGQISMKLDLEKARTVDGERAKVDTTPKPSANGQPRLLEAHHDVDKLIRALARADDDIIDAKLALEPYKEALKSAEQRREAIVVQLVAAGHSAQWPQLPLVPA